jgi:hypothetical protein
MRTTRLTLAALSLAIPLAVMAEPAAGPSAAKKAPPRREPMTLVEKVRFGVNSTPSFQNPFLAMSVGYRNETGCVSGPNGGASGISLVFDPSPLPGFFPMYVNDGVLDGTFPEALIYEPTGTGIGFRLVGAEFIQLADDWAQRVKDNPALPQTPRVGGHLMHYVGAPNSYHLPPFYSLRVWAFQDNPKGAFADFNPLVSCNRAQTDDLPPEDVGP